MGCATLKDVKRYFFKHDFPFALGGMVRAFYDGTRMPGMGEALAAAAAVRRGRVARAIGKPRLKAAVKPFGQMTVKELRAEARLRGIKGRSKARRKAELMALLRGG